MKNYKALATKLNYDLSETDLVFLTFGNASVIDDDRTKVYIKPSGVNYKKLKDDNISVVDIQTGELIDGLKPSVDLDIHLEIYRSFKEINSVIHTHSKFVTIFAQSKKEIPIIGTTHADYFKGNIPITDELTESEIVNNYEKNIGKKVVKLFQENNPLEIPAALISNHGCVVFGKNSKECLDNAIVLEFIAEMAHYADKPETTENENVLYKFHHERKHGKGKYYGQ